MAKTYVVHIINLTFYKGRTWHSLNIWLSIFNIIYIEWQYVLTSLSIRYTYDRYQSKFHSGKVSEINFLQLVSSIFNPTIHMLMKHVSRKRVKATKSGLWNSAAAFEDKTASMDILQYTKLAHKRKYQQ